MHPNDNFKFYYPSLWEDCFHQGERLPPHEIHAGLYSLFLCAGHSTGLYPILLESLGPQNANAAMDYAMFIVSERSSASYLMPDFSLDQLLFSETHYSDSWYSDFFERKLTDDAVHRFRAKWLDRCLGKGHRKVWICVDASNNDCAVRDSDLAERGKAKSLKPVNIYSYIWAVSAIDGRPVTWFVNNGGKVDSKAFDRIEKFIVDSGMEIEGFILDRGFATENILRLIRSTGHHYVVMLKSSSLAFRTMFGKHAEEIRCRLSRLVDCKGLFGTVEQTQVFGTGQETANVALYFNPSTGTRRTLALLESISVAYEDVMGQIASGLRADDIAVPPEARGWFSVVADEEGSPRVEFSERMQGRIDGGGYSAIASSKDMSAREISRTYDYRDVSEKQFSILKSQMDGDTTGVHKDSRIKSKIAVCFIASVLRTEIMLACRKLNLPTNKMLREANGLLLALMPNDRYRAIWDLSARMGSLLSLFGLGQEHMDFLAEELNHRRDPIHSQLRAMPPITPGPELEGVKEEEKETPDSRPRRRPGRPKGSRNRKTIEKEALEALAPPKEKRRPGRPKGSRNRKTLEREALEQEALQRGRRKPGRPKGSKNKKPLEGEKLGGIS